MNTRLLLSRLSVLVLTALLAVSCRTCPIESCHTRKVHFHNGSKFRGQPWFKKQNPAIGEKIKTHNPKSGQHKNDRSKTLK
ncbi:hypothetical protein KLP40_03960 [Hymenobacter sp. NST-14]|uniref:hypothetical protein n=1 Tax=Hymenobacter piscis TaxID=2839984 RepID=UPI001C0306B9|nr:hypothetical protein [Hymenobacter piscis]MBT9392308.1 hypothetical protein [Hymenobacter piscis]